MATDIEEVLGMYTQELMDNYTKLQYTILFFSPCNFVGACMSKVKKGVIEGVSIAEVDYGICLRLESNAPTFVPTKTDDPSKYLQTLIKMIAKYGMVSNVPYHFASHLEKMGYTTKPRPWGNHDYVIDNNVLVDLPGGAFKKDRYYHKRSCGIVDFVPITKEDYIEVRKFEESWRSNFTRRNPGVSVGKVGFLSNSVKMLDQMPKACKPCYIGARLKTTGQLVMVGNGELCSSSVWGSTFRYVDTELMPNGASSCMHLLGVTFKEAQYEVDGSAGGDSTTGLVQFKEHFITESVVNKQLHFFLVGR